MTPESHPITSGVNRIGRRQLLCSSPTGRLLLYTLAICLCIDPVGATGRGVEQEKRGD